MPWVDFKVKRALYEDQDKLGFFRMEGESRGKPYQIIYNSHEEDSTEKKTRIINGLKVFPVESKVELTGNWHIFVRLVGTSISLNTFVNPKDFRESTANIVQENYSVPRASVFVRRQDDALALLGVLEAENEFRKAKLRLEGGEQRALDIIDKIIPSKRVADESSRPVPGDHPGEPQSTTSRSDGLDNEAGSTQGPLPGERFIPINKFFKPADKRNADSHQEEPPRKHSNREEESNQNEDDEMHDAVQPGDQSVPT